MEKMTPQEIGRLVREGREKLSLSQAKLAEMVGTAQQTIEKIEGGKVRRSGYMLDIFKVLGLSVDQIPIEAARSAAAERVQKMSDLSLGSRVRELRLRLLVDVRDLAALAGLTPGQIEAAEEGQYDEGAKVLFELLAEWEQGNAGSMPTVFDARSGSADVMALPAAIMRTPYFRTGERSGIEFSHFGRGRFPANTFVLTIGGAWVKGPVKPGDQLFLKAGFFSLGEDFSPRPILAFPARVLPADLSELVFGKCLAMTREDFSVQTGANEKPLILNRDRWVFSEVIGWYTQEPQLF